MTSLTNPKVKYLCFTSAGLKQKYTQSNGRRPFGISCLLAGFDYDGTPHLYQTEPSGIYYEWKVCVLIAPALKFCGMHFGYTALSLGEHQ
jgi:20S proteasome alpha/beta subunit